MRELEEALARLVRIVSSEIPRGASWRLVVIGSAAAGEVTIDGRTGTWRSDIEAYLESPDDRLASWLGRIHRRLEGMQPCFDLSGGDPRKMSRWDTRQWLVDAGRIGRRLAGSGDAWDEPFATFADRPVPRADAAVLLSNRCAGMLEGGGDPYVLAKAVIDTVGAGLILLGRHETTVARRLESVGSPEIARELVRIGIPAGLIDRFVDAATWKLTGDPLAEELFRERSAPTSWLLRAAVSALLRQEFGCRGKDGVEGFELWARTRDPANVVRDWLRALRRAPSALFGALRWWSVGPLWGARLGVVRAWALELDETHRRRALGDWKLVAKGV